MEKDTYLQISMGRRSLRRNGACELTLAQNQELILRW